MSLNQRGVRDVLQAWVNGKDVAVKNQSMTSDELKAAFAALPPMEPVEPAHNWEFWAWDLRQNVADKDPAEFLTWQGLVSTMFVGNAPYIDYEYEVLPLSIQNEIDDPQVGKPELFTRPGVETSGNLIHQAYHLWQWERINNRIDTTTLSALETIIEIGGGYGAMALICHRLGFRGRYIIYDLPEFSLLQQYYLSNVGVPNVEFKTQIDKQMDEADLLIGLFSLNEMPLHARETIIDLCPTQSYLIAYGASWGGIDNMAWALDLMKRKGYNWRNWNISHLPNCWYLIGDKRE